jgi:hypothetical protein
MSGLGGSMSDREEIIEGLKLVIAALTYERSRLEPKYWRDIEDFYKENTIYLNALEGAIEHLEAAKVESELKAKAS